METQKNDEKNIVLEMKRLLGRMMVQVDYMYRNDREMSQLDLDIMMERTREFYELLCDYQSDKVENVGANHHLPDVEINEGGELVNHDVEFEVETPEEVLKEHEITEIPEKENDEDKADEEEEHPIGAIHVLPIDENDVDDNDDVDEDEEDWEDEDDEMFRVEPVTEEPVKEEPVEEEPVDEEPIAEEPVTEPEDNSLAARLQRTPVTDIRLSLGINDKVMIINDLFMGSVERYNKSIDALNDFPTLSGAKVYMSELQIELQWDVDSMAYRMLNDLVERRFI